MCVSFGEKFHCQQRNFYLKCVLYLEVRSWEGTLIMKNSLKKKVTTIASVACLSAFMVACGGTESSDQAAVDDAQENLQESTDAASEAVGEAASDAEALVESQADAAEDAMDDAADAEKVEQPASFDAAADDAEDAAAEAGEAENLENTLNDAKERLDSAKEEINGAQE